MQIAVRRSLALAVASTLALGLPAYAGTLGPGQSATVQPGDTPEDWQLNNAELIVNPGAATLDLVASEGSVMKISGAQVSAAKTDGGIQLRNSTMTMTSSSVTNTNGRAMSLALITSSLLPASRADITNSQFTGLGLGISVSASLPGLRAVLNLDKTTVTGQLNNGASLEINPSGQPRGPGDPLYCPQWRAACGWQWQPA